jgi:hypothetical protein
MGAGVPGQSGELAVRDDLSVRDPAQDLGHGALEGSRLVEVDLNVEKPVALAGEEPDKAVRERMSLASCSHPGSRQLVPEQDLAFEHDLADPPALRCVGQPPRHA